MPAAVCPVTPCMMSLQPGGVARRRKKWGRVRRPAMVSQTEGLGGKLP